MDSAATTHLGCLPRPVQVLPASSRYLGATLIPALARFAAALRAGLRPGLAEALPGLRPRLAVPEPKPSSSAVIP